MMDIIKESIKKAKQGREQFLKNELAIGKQFPKGLKAYFSERIFELKKKAKKETLLGAAWVNSGCPEISKSEMFGIVDVLERQMNTKLQKRLPKNIRLSNLQEDETDPFFALYGQIKTLERYSPLKETQPNTPQSFEDIFQPRYKKHFKKFVDILRDVDPPLINVSNEWIGSKGAARVFKEALEMKGIIYVFSREAIYSAFEFFPNLGKSFMKSGTNFNAEDYRGDFERMIEHIITTTDRK